jgi:hypothetical protein
MGNDGIRIDQPDENRYTKHERAIDAIVQWLKDKGTPQSPDAIRDGVIAGGWNKGDLRAAFHVTDTLDFFLKRQGANKKRLKNIGGLVGLYEWDDEKP